MMRVARRLQSILGATTKTHTRASYTGGSRHHGSRRVGTPIVSPDQPLLAIAGVSKYFGGVRAVEDVTVAIRRGEIMSVIGPNGAGKTSLLNMISGFYRPTSGTITLEGRDITHARPSQIAALGVARTFQNIALFAGMTVLDNIMLGRHVHMRAGVLSSFVYWGLAQKEELAHRARVEELIDFLELQNIRKQPSAALPYGLRKRVELGRALALEPKVLLLDEPMDRMDSRTTAMSWRTARSAGRGRPASTGGVGACWPERNGAGFAPAPSASVATVWSAVALVGREQPGPGAVVRDECCGRRAARLVPGHRARHLLARCLGDYAGQLGEEGVGNRAIALAGEGGADAERKHRCRGKHHGLHRHSPWFASAVRRKLWI